jgi:two-component system NarL family response regulator
VTVTEPAKIRVVIVDDHPVVRHGVRALIEAEPDMEVVGECGDGEEAVASYERLRPDVTLMDLRLPGLSGPEAIAAIRRSDPAARVVVLTSYDGDEDVYRAVQAGASGYILKGTFGQGLVEAIRAVHGGATLVAPEVAELLTQRRGLPSLSSREIQILELVAKGLSNGEIGAVLSLAEGTIKTHLKRIFAKMDVTDRTEAALVAVQRGIIRID